MGTLFEGHVAYVTLKGLLPLGRLVLTDRGALHAPLRPSTLIWFYTSTEALMANELHTLATGFPTQAALRGCHLARNLLMLP